MKLGLGAEAFRKGIGDENTWGLGGVWVSFELGYFCLSPEIGELDGDKNIWEIFWNMLVHRSIETLRPGSTWLKPGRR
jgi:hypothetical protein